MDDVQSGYKVIEDFLQMLQTKYINIAVLKNIITYFIDN